MTPIRIFGRNDHDKHLPSVQEGQRVVHIIDQRYPGTVTRIGKNYVKVVYDDGVSVRMDWRPDAVAYLPSPGTWEVLPFVKFPRIAKEPATGPIIEGGRGHDREGEA